MFDGIPRYHGTMGRDGQEGLNMYPRPGTGGMSHGIPRHYGTMGCPKVPVDSLRQSWTTMLMGAEIYVVTIILLLTCTHHTVVHLVNQTIDWSKQLEHFLTSLMGISSATLSFSLPLFLRIEFTLSMAQQCLLREMLPTNLVVWTNFWQIFFCCLYSSISYVQVLQI